MYNKYDRSKKMCSTTKGTCNKKQVDDVVYEKTKNKQMQKERKNVATMQRCYCTLSSQVVPHTHVVTCPCPGSMCQGDVGCASFQSDSEW